MQRQTNTITDTRIDHPKGLVILIPTTYDFTHLVQDLAIAGYVWSEEASDDSYYPEFGFNIREIAEHRFDCAIHIRSDGFMDLIADKNEVAEMMCDDTQPVMNKVPFTTMLGIEGMSAVSELVNETDDYAILV